MCISLSYNSRFFITDKARLVATALTPMSGARSCKYVPIYTHCSDTSTRLEFSTVDDLSVGLYDLQITLASSVEAQLSSISPTSMLVLYLAGLVSAFSPCEVGLLPLTLAYLGSSSLTETSIRIEKAISYAFGLSASLTCFGLLAAYFGNVYGAVNLGRIPSLFTGGLVLIMGFGLLDLIEIKFPTIPLWRDRNLPEPFNSIAYGASSALVSTPCTSPVLASLLAHIITSSTPPALGAALLMSYSLGFTTPVVAAGFFTVGGVSNAVIPWANKLFASLMICYATYTLVGLLFPMEASTTLTVS